jgi:hypothetical protein
VITIARHDYGHDERSAQAQQLYNEAMQHYANKVRRRQFWRRASAVAAGLLAVLIVMAL